MPSPVDYLIILGAGLNEDQLSWTLWERVDKGLKLLQDNPDMKVVASGGQGPGEWITEAEAMQRYLKRQSMWRSFAQINAIFLVMPEEDNTKYFIISLIVQQFYREILSVADEHGGKLPNRVMMFLDEIGTIPKIESAEMMFSASRSRLVSNCSHHPELCTAGERLWPRRLCHHHRQLPGYRVQWLCSQ